MMERILLKNERDYPRSFALFKRAIRSLPGGNTRTTVFVSPYPPYAKMGHGLKVFDEDGNSVLDFNNNYSSLIHGHNHPKVMQAVFDQLDNGVVFGLPTKKEIECAEELNARTKWFFNWRFTNSGSEATMLSTRIARAHSGKDIIIRIEGSYHGNYEGFYDLGTPGVSKKIGDFTKVFNGINSAELFDYLEKNQDFIACIILDLMPNRSGLILQDVEETRTLRRKCMDLGILFIVDEVITYRLGMRGLCGYFDIKPDLVVYGKFIGGGFPIGAVGGKPEIMKLLDPNADKKIDWGGTFNANPISMTAGIVTLKMLEPETISRLNTMGDSLRQGLQNFGIKVNGSGSLLKIFSKNFNSTWHKLYKSGVLIGSTGLISLSTPMTEEHTEHLFKILRSECDLTRI